MVKTREGKFKQAVAHTDGVYRVTRGDAATRENIHEYTPLPHVVTLPDGTNMTFFARRSNAPTLEEIMDEIYELAMEELVQKLPE